jgi:hypothetical protein
MYSKTFYIIACAINAFGTLFNMAMYRIIEAPIFGMLGFMSLVGFMMAFYMLETFPTDVK